MFCIKCEKSIQPVDGCPNNPDEAGEFILKFYYGSRHDQCDGHYPPQEPSLAFTRATNLIRCSTHVVGYVCDDCFSQYARLFDGWVRDKSAPNGRKVL